MKELWLELKQLYISFFKVGVLTFGGGMAMLPMLQAEVVDKQGWTTEEELLDYYAVGQCTPGVIAVNTATFIGFKRKRYLGAAVATIGVVSPSLIIIMFIAAFLGNISEYEVVQNALWGIKIAASALILSSIINLYKNGVKDLFGMVMFLGAIIVTGICGISSVYIVIASIIVGNIYGYFKNKKDKEELKS